MLVVGSAHLDIRAHAHPRQPGVDSQGEVSIQMGGSGLHLAEAFARLGCSVRFVTAMAPSAYSRMIELHLNEQGIDTSVAYDPNLPSGGFSAHVDGHGQVYSSVSHVPVERARFDEAQVRAALQSMQAVVCDAYLSYDSLQQWVDLANAQSVPIYLFAVDESSGERLVGLRGRIHGLFMNQREYTAFSHHLARNTLVPVDVAATQFGAPLVVTQGAQAALVAHPQGGARRAQGPGPKAPDHLLREPIASATIFHRMLGQPLDQAVALALQSPKPLASEPGAAPGTAHSLERSINRIIHRAGHDAMTGLLNRHSTERMLGVSLERRKQGLSGELSLLILDIDHFKQVNDTYGHNVGDEVIVAVSRTAQQCLRAQDYMGRWGGEEFIVVLPEANQEQAMAVAERIRKAVEQTVRHPRQVTISVGCAQLDSPQMENIRSLMESADKALYVAKKSGRNRVVSARQVENDSASCA